MDWNNVEPDEYALIGVHYTHGRQGRAIKGVTLHHNAGNLTIQDCHDVWQSREASAHYQVDANGRVGQLVNDADTAWACGNWEANLTTISIEHANDHVGDPWTIGAATLESGAHLVAALCKYYGLGRPEWMSNVYPHSHWSATACPGEIAASQRDQYMRRAQEWYDAMAAGTDAPAASSASPAPAAQAPAASPAPNVRIRYALHVLGGRWLEEVSDFNNSDGDGFAGMPGCQHDMLIAYVDHGALRYRAHTPQSGWLDWVGKADYGDDVYGMAGVWGQPIDGVQMYYSTPDGEEYQRVYYRAGTVGMDGYLAVCSDDGTNGDGLDGWAGVYGQAVDKLQCAVRTSNPF